MADIFISYSKAYRGLTQELAQELQDRGFSVWWDSDLLSGDRFREVILGELAQARAAIVIWTPASIKSDRVRAEASRARARGILIPVRDADIAVDDIPPPFDVLHTDLVSNRPALYAALASFGVGPSATAQPKPVVPPSALSEAVVTEGLALEPRQAVDPNGANANSAESELTTLRRSQQARRSRLPLLAGAGVLALLLLGGLGMAISDAGREFSCRTLGILCAEVVASPRPDPCAAAEAHRKSVEAIGDVEAFEDHLVRFPNCAFAGLARAKIEDLKKKTAVVVPPVQPAAPCGGITLASLSSRPANQLSAGEERALKPKDVFKECETCPEMVAVPAGEFTIGSPQGEPGRKDDEGPQHRVIISRPLAVGRVHVTVKQFSAFVNETGYDAGSKCFTWVNGKWEETEGRSWRNPSFSQDDTYPAVCLNWNDAEAYAARLSRKTGKAYRLLTEAEWEYAARAGSTTRYYFGDDEKDFCRYGNGGDQTQKRSGWTGTFLPCADGYLYTAPAGSFLPNAFGLYDMHGNAWHWVEDCYQDSYDDAPSDGSAITIGDCSRRVIRGGSWNSGPRNLRSAKRSWNTTGYRDSILGFRVGRTLTP